MKKLEILLSTYGESHQHTVNKFIHWICVPAIMLSLVGLLAQLPFPLAADTWLNWASLILAAAVIYYFKLSWKMAIGFILISVLLLWANAQLNDYCLSRDIRPVPVLVALFAIAWIGQFVGHAIEGKRPSFFMDIQFLLIGPAWLLHFIYKKLKIDY